MIKFKEDTVLVSFTKRTDTDTSLLIVGRKRPNESVDIVNTFSGEEAEELYNRLVTKKEN